MLEESSKRRARYEGRFSHEGIRKYNSLPAISNKQSGAFIRCAPFDDKEEREGCQSADKEKHSLRMAPLAVTVDKGQLGIG